ncbi:hypothetical protein [Streptomyces sp. NBC_00820]|uniref:hypothetical protein n=1 Tax=Streptomyces sp. NBC_00820 TaxID=2975842 RepID=UPI002ED42E8F
MNRPTHRARDGAGSPYAGLYGGLVLLSRLRENDPGQSAISFTHLDAGLPDAERLLDPAGAKGAELTDGPAAAGTPAD